MKKTSIVKFFVLAMIIFTGLSGLAIEAKSAEVLKISIGKSTQSGKDYSIPVIIKILSSIDSDKFELNVTTPRGMTIRENPALFVAVKANIEYELVYHLDPLQPGDYKVFVEGQLWQAKTNFRAVDGLTIKINENLEMEPVSDEFVKERKNAQLLDAAIRILLLLAFIAALILGILRFRNYLNAEDKK